MMNTKIDAVPYEIGDYHVRPLFGIAAEQTL